MKRREFVGFIGGIQLGVQPGLKNLTDHFLEEFWRPAAVVSYSAGRFAGARAATAWHGILSEMEMVSSTIAVGPIVQTLSAEAEPIGAGGQAIEPSVPGALPTISCGGWKRRKRSGSIRPSPS
jgi:hypothetical protein